MLKNEQQNTRNHFSSRGIDRVGNRFETSELVTMIVKKVYLIYIYSIENVNCFAIHFAVLKQLALLLWLQLQLSHLNLSSKLESLEN